MKEPEDAPPPADPNSRSLFGPAWPQYNRPSQAVTLGHYYPTTWRAAATNLLREDRGSYTTSLDTGAVRQNLGWTQVIDALNKGRQWPLKRLFDILNPMLEPEIALVTVPTHIAYQAFWPTRTLAQRLAEQGRIDATACLVRHTSIRRIVFGGPSTRSLHRQTIRVEYPDLVAGRRVLLLDDIIKSGASLAACREMLFEAGAGIVQALALGRVIAAGAEGE